MIGEYVTKKFGQELLGMALKGEKNEDVCVLCKYFPKGELSRKNFNNQVIRMIHFVDRSCPFFPATSVITHWADEQSVNGVKNGSYAWVQKHGFSVTKADC